MTLGKPLGLESVAGLPLSAAWTGAGYVACQSVFATVLGSDGRTLLPVTRTWDSAGPGGSTAVAGWGEGRGPRSLGTAPGGSAAAANPGDQGFVFASVRPHTLDPWGWGGCGSVVGVTVTPKGAHFELDQLNALVPETDKNREFFLLADGFVSNCLDAARWFNQPGWPALHAPCQRRLRPQSGRQRDRGRPVRLPGQAGRHAALRQDRPLARR